MRYYLDQTDWEADYFITDDQYAFWRGSSGHIEKMWMDTAVSAGFCSGELPAAYRGRIPGSDRTMLWENEVISDPYLRRNLDHSRWSEKQSWAFRTRFSVPEDMRKAKKLRLVFAAVDYEVEVYLNGEKIASHLGAFIPLEVDISNAVLRNQGNILAMVFAPATQALPNQLQDDHADFAKYHRSQMSYGWDWMRAMVPVGITDRVWLESSDNVRIKDIFFRSKSSHVTLAIESEVAVAGQYQLTIKMEPFNFVGQGLSLQAVQALEQSENHTFQFEFDVPDVHYWFPNGYGETSLYRLTVELGDANWEAEVGLRDIQMLRNPDSPADAYNQTFCINGQAVFARGLNWVPIDLMPGREQNCDYERLISLAAAGGFNLLRIWGGGIVERDEFYRCCDRHGMLVWQEFMHSCSSYPDDEEYVGFKRREGEIILKKLRNHVSLSLICGGNEMQYYGQKPDSRLLLQYGELAARLTPDLDYHLSCPDRSRAGERDHGPWWVEKHSTYNQHFRLVASEIGCFGMPEPESIERFIPRSTWIDFPKGQNWNYHFLKLYDINGLFKQVENFAVHGVEEYVKASQFMQADSLQYFMQHYRVLWPQASGCFIWQYNEPWPTLSLSLVDYYSLPKMAFYWLKRVNAAQLVAVIDDDLVISDNIYRGKVQAVFDRPIQEAKVVIRVLDMAGKVWFCEEHSSLFAAGVHDLTEINLSGFNQGNSALLIIESEIYGCSGALLWSNSILRGINDFKSALNEASSQVELSVIERNERSVTVRLTNTSMVPALNVRLQAPSHENKELFWQDNYITLAPGAQRQIVLEYTEVMPETIQVSGWNMTAFSIKL